MHRSLLLALAACVSTAKPAPTAGNAGPTAAPIGSAAATDSADTKAIRDILEAFRTGIIAKDEAKLAALFISPDAPFRAVNVDATHRPFTTTAGAFAREVAAATTPLEERFTDVRIVATPGLATLDSAYSFHADGVMTNDGREVWVLVETQAGWKIASVTWSVRDAKPSPK